MTPVPENTRRAYTDDEDAFSTQFVDIAVFLNLVCDRPLLATRSLPGGKVAYFFNRAAAADADRWRQMRERFFAEAERTRQHQVRGARAAAAARKAGM